MSVLQCLHSTHEKQQVFAAGQNGMILDQSTVNERKHVKSTMKPVDIGTRAVTRSQLQESWKVNA